MNLIKNTSSVVTKQGRQEAFVIGVCIRGADNSSIEYNIAWFKDGTRHTAWVDACEIEEKPIEKPVNVTGFGTTKPPSSRTLKENGNIEKPKSLT